MCGIVGYFSDQPNPNLEIALDALKHRGPDDEGIYRTSDGLVGFGHKRLSIIDTSPAGHQPMIDPETGAVLLFNGMIYNYKELREILDAEGAVFAGQSDSEVLLKSLIREGAAILPKLRGIFAFSFYDPQTKTMLLARDSLGIKPLYYQQNDHGVGFGSELKALLKLMPEKIALDHVALYRYLTFIYAPGENSPAMGYKTLGPGCAMTIEAGEITRQWSWYDLPTISPPGKITNLDEALSGVASHFQTAVERQLTSDVPLGAFLSGGLDSSAIVALARKSLPDIQCFTIDTSSDSEGFSDDLPYARKVAKHLNVPLEIICVDANAMIENLEQMVVQMDEPIADPAALNAFYIANRAREMGFKVLLSGAGGDDLFTGYRRHYALTVEKYWSWLPQSIRSGLENGTSKLNQKNSLFRRIRKAFRGASLSDDQRLIEYFRWIDNKNLLGLLSSDFRANISAGDAERPMLEVLKRFENNDDRMDKMLALEQKFFLTDHNLVYTDRMSMAAAIEVRVPFLDEDLVQFASRIPSHFKQKGRVGKWILKKAMEPYLPHEVIYRPKTGFGAPLRQWITGELSEYTNDMLSQTKITSRNLFDYTSVRQLIDDNKSGKIDASYTIFTLLCIEIWCAQYIDKPRERAIGLIASPIPA